MDLFDFIKLWEWTRKPVRSLFVRVIAFLIVVGVAAFLYAYFQEKGRQKASEPAYETIVIESRTRHVGVNDKPEYPEEQARGMTEVMLDFTLRSRPRKAVLIVDVYDIDQIGGEVWVNGVQVGTFTQGVPWHEDPFDVNVSILKPGTNQLKVKANTWPNGQIEDFLFRRARIQVEY